jgi:hypothetical protein
LKNINKSLWDFESIISIYNNVAEKCGCDSALVFFGLLEFVMQFVADAVVDMAHLYVRLSPDSTDLANLQGTFPECATEPSERVVDWLLELQNG